MFIEIYVSPFYESNCTWIKTKSQLNSKERILLGAKELIGNLFATKYCLKAIANLFGDKITLKALDRFVIDRNNNIIPFKTNTSRTLVIVSAYFKLELFHCLT